ncbi:glycosyltransferase family 4 protein [Lysinibacillus sp. Ag94]|uniref:glycosyltransferase family 4 protein n=1 Tax=Lysinibacillus sp. Ag94 TaxID=2936682 RepID=UPI00200E8BFC|nr:glycosyltransferase family 4 protein [Lysinibacillus sp. Ag94]UPW83709.1 glycosyltransferase family 4 protein [Lysinibacillus sp. Ag94]
MKILFVASVYRHLTAFHIPYIQYFQKCGYEVHAAGTGEGKKNLEEINVKCIDIPFSRSPLNSQNIVAYKQLQQLFVKEKFNLVHVHTPVAALLTRAAFRKIKLGKMVYTAHGFHFFAGAPKLNWLIYYSAERLAAKWTDHLITINEEDFKNAQKLLPKEKISLVHGVGVEIGEHSLTDEEKQQLRSSLGLVHDAVTIACIAELNDNKNHQFLLRNWRQIKLNNPKLELLIIGDGDKERELRSFVAKEQLSGVRFLGFREDVLRLLQIIDIVTLLSHREGLPKSIMEAMVNNIPCVVTNTRGLRDLIKSNENGFIVSHEDDRALVSAFTALAKEEPLRKRMGQKAKQSVEPYLLDKVLQEYISIYERLLK